MWGSAQPKLCPWTCCNLYGRWMLVLFSASTQKTPILLDLQNPKSLGRTLPLSPSKLKLRMLDGPQSDSPVLVNPPSEDLSCGRRRVTFSPSSPTVGFGHKDERWLSQNSTHRAGREMFRSSFSQQKQHSWFLHYLWQVVTQGGKCALVFRPWQYFCRE